MEKQTNKHWFYILYFIFITFNSSAIENNMSGTKLEEAAAEREAADREAAAKCTKLNQLQYYLELSMRLLWELWRCTNINVVQEIKTYMVYIDAVIFEHKKDILKHKTYFDIMNDAESSLIINLYNACVLATQARESAALAADNMLSFDHLPFADL